MFKKILIANRGEIAVRVLRACRELGVPALWCIATWTDVTTREVGGRSHRIGPAPSRESYLSIDNVLRGGARGWGDAVHPGYGFLARECRICARVCVRRHGFIGPSPEAMERLGSKTRRAGT